MSWQSEQADDIETVFYATRRLNAGTLETGPSHDLLDDPLKTAQRLSLSMQNLAVVLLRLVDAIEMERNRRGVDLLRCKQQIADLERKTSELEARR